LRALARVGKWDRALDLVRLSTDRKGPGLLAIVEGLLIEGSPSSLDLVQGVVNQIPKTGEDAADRALALGQIAVNLAGKGNKQATILFDEAENYVEALPSLDT
jgi:hypothetical protein